MYHQTGSGISYPQMRSVGKLPTDSPGGYMLAGEDDGMAADSGAGTNDGGNQRNLIVVIRVMGMRVDAGEGADDGALADGNAAAVV